ncbi:MAG: integrase arm-type DNA-binding domain-containing protein [Alphaproteobacteria bacterium]
MALTEIAIKSAKLKDKPYKLSDALGLYLLVQPNGSRLWRLKYRYSGKEKLLALGRYPEINLRVARERRDEARLLLKEGKDPAAERKTKKHEARIAVKNTFESVAFEFAEKQNVVWTTGYRKATLRRLELNIFPDLGRSPIAEITPLQFLEVVRKIEARGATELAHRMTQVCGQIFRYAVIEGRCPRDITTDLRGALIPHVTKHMPAIRPGELPELLIAIKGYDGEPLVRLGQQFLALTFVRTGELIGAMWPEFDETETLWYIPAPRMKMKLEHLVPLARQTRELLTQLRAVNGQRRFVFASPAKPHKHISNNTLLYALYRLGYHSRMTGHGFRAVASTIFNEQRSEGRHSFDRDAIERQLAHVERNKVRGAYNRAEYIITRREMMQWWADYLDEQAGGQFVEPAQSED